MTSIVLQFQNKFTFAFYGLHKTKFVKIKLCNKILHQNFLISVKKAMNNMQIVLK